MLVLMGRHLMGAKEIEERLGVSRQRVYQLTSRSDWPHEYDELAMGKVWRIEDVEAWIREHRPALDEAEPAPTPTRKGRKVAMKSSSAKSGSASLPNAKNSRAIMRPHKAQRAHDDGS